MGIVILSLIILVQADVYEKPFFINLKNAVGLGVLQEKILIFLERHLPNDEQVQLMREKREKRIRDQIANFQEKEAEKEQKKEIRDDTSKRS